MNRPPVTSRLPQSLRYPADCARILLVYGLRAARDHFRRLLGKQPVPGEIEKFCRRHIGHIARFRPILTLTVTDHVATEGAGSKALMVMYTISLCRAHGLQYVHTPFRNLAHAQGDCARWDAAWESFFNLGDGENPADEASEEAFDYFQLNYLEHRSGRRWLDHVRPPLPEDRALYYFDNPAEPGTVEWAGHRQRFARLLADNVSDFRSRYRSAGNRAEPAPFTVCVHVRRGDVTPARDDMWTDIHAYTAIIAAITETLGARGVAARVEVFTDGDPADLAPLEAMSSQILAGHDAMDSLARMINADVLVTAKSCFSYVAALLCEGVVIHDDAYLPALDGWILREPDGHFDTTAFGALVDTRLPRKA